MREPTKVLLSTGQHMPLIGLGTYKLQSADAVKTALELGYRHFDCKFCRRKAWGATDSRACITV